MKRPRLKKLFVMLSPWKWEGVVLVGGTVDDFKAFAKRWIDADVEPGAYGAGHCYVEYGKPWILWVENLKNFPTLAHEAYHVTHGVLEGRGLRHSEGSEEAFTYTMEDILRQTLNAKRWTLA